MANNTTVAINWSSLCGDVPLEELQHGPDMHGELFYHYARIITGLVCYPILVLLGLTTNVLTIIVLTRRGMMNSTNFFLAALAVSDILKLMNDLLYTVVILLVITDPGTAQAAFAYLYPYAHYIFQTACCVSAWLIVAVAVERYIMVCHPTRAKAICTEYRAKLVSAGIVLGMVVLLIPCAMRYRTMDRCRNSTGEVFPDAALTELWQNNDFRVGFVWFQNILRSILPLVVLIILSAFIIHAVRQTRANKKLAGRNRITLMLIAVIVVFMISITPDVVMSLGGFGYTEDRDYYIKGIREFTDLLLVVNPSVNFFLYNMNPAFRRELVALFPFLNCCGITEGNAQDHVEGDQGRRDANPSSAPAKVMLQVKRPGRPKQETTSARPLLNGSDTPTQRADETSVLLLREGVKYDAADNVQKPKEAEQSGPDSHTEKQQLVSNNYTPDLS